MKIKEIKYSLFDNPLRDLQFDERHEQYYQSARWKYKRERRLAIDGYKCLLCGSTKNLQVHHKFGIDFDDVSLLRTLCKSCHELVHQDPEEARRLEWIVMTEENKREARQMAEWYASYADYDLLNGGKYNLCKTEDIKEVFGEDAQIMTIRSVFTELRHMECFKYFKSGYTETETGLITGFSKTVLKKAHKHYTGENNYPKYESEDYYMKKVDITNVQEAGEIVRPEAGAYNCVITAVEDIAEKEYLKVTYDIAEGKYKGYYTELRENHPDWLWSGAYVKSYKQAALPMFKRFCSAVSKSNGNFVFDGGAVNADEKTLIGKHIGLVFQDEDYYSNSGDIKTRLIVYSECPVDKVKDQKVPKPKKLKAAVDFVVDDFTSDSGEPIPW